jgi:hypothetical protein
MRVGCCMLLIAVFSLQPKLIKSQNPPRLEAISKMAGTWSSATLEQFGASMSPQCPYVAVTERKVTLKPIPGTNRLEGEWVRWSRLTWLMSGNQNCRWYPTEEQYEPILGASWTYNLAGNPSETQSNVLMVQGTYVNCLGNGCSQMQFGGTAFSTELKLIGGSLVDTNKTEDQADDVSFTRLSDEADLLDEARTAVEGYLKSLDQGQIDHFYTTASSSEFRAKTTLEQFHSSISALQTKVGLVQARRYLLTTHILYAPMISKSKADYVLFSNKVESTSHTSGLETIFLVREKSDWKVFWISYD